MITIAVPAEGDQSEQRVALSPETAKKFAALGAKVRVQAGAGAGANFSDAEFKQAGAKVEKSAAATLKGADIILTDIEFSEEFPQLFRPLTDLCPELFKNQLMDTR